MTRVLLAFLLAILSLFTTGCAADRVEHYAVDQIVASCARRSGGTVYSQRADCCAACADALKLSSGGAVEYWKSARALRIGYGLLGAALAVVAALAWRRRAAKPGGQSRPPRSARAFLLGWLMIPALCIGATTGVGEAWLSKRELPRLLGAAEAARALHRNQMHTFPNGTEDTSFACAATLDVAVEDTNECRIKVAGFEGLAVPLGPMPDESQRDDYRAELRRHVDELRDSALRLRVNGHDKVYTEAELASPLPSTEAGVYEEIPLYGAVARSPRFLFVAGLPAFVWAFAPFFSGLGVAWLVRILRRRRRSGEIYEDIRKLTEPVQREK